MKRIDFIYFDAGGGHRAAATALKQVIEREGLAWEVRLVNLQELLRPLDVFRKLTGIELENLYNKMLARGWTLGSAQGLRVIQWVVRRYRKQIVALLARHWQETQPDLVVSVVPNFNRPLFEGLRQSFPRVPYVTILTDFADYPPHFWIEQGQEQYFICGTERAERQALDAGHPRERVLRTSGMILRPTFYDPIELDRAVERKKLGLDPEKPTGLVLFGGAGSKVMAEIARDLADIQLILICGRNEGLAERLRAMSTSVAHFVQGFTSEVPYYMALSDFFIGKPGPGSISEAVAMRLPVIVERNAFTLPQERYNTDWVLEQGVGKVIPNFRQVRGAVEELLGDLERYRSATARIENRAIFEIPPMLERILEQAVRG